ncbi:Flp pilus assembly complex ATPase component TadA [Candidatus Dojkabacteria bacterium]|nr:Flp pilus assembly complex ATPase component TadA [Candidatus Dojkabacteria bacterium]
MPSNSVVQKLIDTGKLTKDDSVQLFIESSRTGKNVETLLLERGTITSVDLVKLKAEIFSVPFIDLSEITIDDKVIGLLPLETMRKYKMLVFQEDGLLVKIAMADPFDVQALEYVKSRLSQFKRFEVYISLREQIISIIDSKSASLIGEEIEESLESVDYEGMEIDDSGADVDTSNENLATAPVAKIVNTIIEYGAKTGASDIHIEPLEEKTRVRYRIHGIMIDKITLPRAVHPSVVARIKIMAKLKIDVKRMPQDGRIPVKYRDRQIDIRVSTLPAIYGEKVVLRLLDRSGKVPPLEESGLRGPAFNTYMQSIKSTVGIILITGPTGSGKTRTLASTLSVVNDEKVNIITLEDPVEIRVRGVNQVQVNPQVGLTFENGLRSILRQDPDIVMVGEIRDAETAKLAVQAALTGHLVLATLHTNSSAAALPRLVDMGVESYLLASTVRAIVGQRLVRTICPHCIQAYEVSPEIVTEINETLSNIDGFDAIAYSEAKCKSGAMPSYYKCPEVDESGIKKLYLYKGLGCDKCSGQGYSGRTGIFEALQMSETIGRMVMKNKPESDIAREAVASGMITMVQDGYLKVLDGITTLEEVMRVINT